MQVEQDLDEGSSERHIKYKELKKRDEMMTNFMETFQIQIAQEKKSWRKNNYSGSMKRFTSRQKVVKYENERSESSSLNHYLNEIKKSFFQILSRWKIK